MEKVRAMVALRDLEFRTRISMEPLYEMDWQVMATFARQIMPEIIECGTDNYRSKHKIPIPGPTTSSVILLLEALKKIPGVQVFKKNSLKKLLKEPAQ